MKPAGIVSLLTDFGHQDPFVGIMKGVILGICPGVTLVDLVHDLPPQSVITGALLLRSAVPHFPPGSVHLAVVDPGVGSNRRPVVISTPRGFLVGPDNGLLLPAAEALGGGLMREITHPQWRPPTLSSTFHGRDLFAPVAAHLAGGATFGQVGPVVREPVPLPMPQVRREGPRLIGEVIHVDRFGNLVTNLPATDLPTAPSLALTIDCDRLRLDRLSRSYSDVHPGSFVAVIGSWDTLEIAVRDGNAAASLGCGKGAMVSVGIPAAAGPSPRC